MKLSIEHHRVGVHMGDHGETIVNAVELADVETVEQLADRLLGASELRLPDYDSFVVIRLVTPAPGENEKEKVPW